MRSFPIKSLATPGFLRSVISILLLLLHGIKVLGFCSQVSASAQFVHSIDYRLVSQLDRQSTKCDVLRLISNR